MEVAGLESRHHQIYASIQFLLRTKGNGQVVQEDLRGEEAEKAEIAVFKWGLKAPHFFQGVQVSR